LLGELEKKEDRVVIADLEAGIGTMLRTDAEQVDVAIVVVEPYMTAIGTGRRLVEIARRNGIARTVVIANKVRNAEDVPLIRTGLGGIEPDLVVPVDEEIAAADLTAVAPIDRNPDSPGIKTIRQLALRLAG
jgi:CO dehydrogenase nickel-insertion accessory protein CooC1